MKLKLDKNDPHVLSVAFLNVMLKIRDIEKKALKDSKLDISPKELHHIVIISLNPGLKQTEILDFLDITKGTYSTMIAGLVKKGFVSQVSDLSDKRIKRLIIEDNGRRALEVNAQVRAQIKRQLLTKISNVEFDTLMDLAMKIG